jgi:hypothetical protein
LNFIGQKYVGGDTYNKAMPTTFPRRLSPALAGMLAVAGVEFFLATAVVLQYLRADLDWVKAPLSFYLIGPHSAWLISAYFILAASILLVGLGLHGELSPPARSLPTLLLFVAAALCICTVALAHTDLPGGAHLTPEGRLHNSAAILAFVCAPLGMLLQAWRLRYDPRWRVHHRRALTLALLIFAVLLVYALHWLPTGAMQKSAILLIVLWLLMTGRWLSLTWIRREAA